jgi:hypothetical protein
MYGSYRALSSAREVKSFVTRPGDERLSDETTDVNFLRKNTNQFADFSHGRGDATVRYTNAGDPVKHFIVFRTPLGRRGQQRAGRLQPDLRLPVGPDTSFSRLLN